MIISAEDVCKKHLKAPDMLIQCILVFILYFISMIIIKQPLKTSQVFIKC